MALAHVSIGKLVGWSVYLCVAVFVALKESVQVAVIMVVGGIVIAFMNIGWSALTRKWDRTDRLREHQELMEGQDIIKKSAALIKENTDGINSRLQTKLDERGTKLADATARADHAEGVKEGSDAERDRPAS